MSEKTFVCLTIIACFLLRSYTQAAGLTGACDLAIRLMSMRFIWRAATGTTAGFSMFTRSLASDSIV